MQIALVCVGSALCDLCASSLGVLELVMHIQTCVCTCAHVCMQSHVGKQMQICKYSHALSKVCTHSDVLLHMHKRTCDSPQAHTPSILHLCWSMVGGSPLIVVVFICILAAHQICIHILSSEYSFQSKRS